MSIKVLSDAQINRFDEDGFLVMEEVFEKAQTTALLQFARQDPILADKTKANANFDGEGLKTVLAYQQDLTDDIYSAWACSARLIAPLEQLLRDKASHYYNLIMQKEPNTGGWQYHQDYGYHYAQFLFPDYISCMVALEPATRENGCIKVYKGSNRLGRLEHQGSGSQLIADPKRMAFVEQHLEEVYCEMAPGSVLYFHGNTLHASDQNLSSTSRWSLVLSYVAASNTVVVPEDPTRIVEKLDDEAVRQIGEGYKKEAVATSA
jgi:ectoine hydroxylase-related dioxygenase (phytanoyl-CoA dioxygenase family)